VAVIKKHDLNLIKTTDMNIVKECQDYFSVSLPSFLIAKRAEEFLAKLK